MGCGASFHMRSGPYYYFGSRARPEKLTTLLSGPFRARSGAWTDPNVRGNSILVVQSPTIQSPTTSIPGKLSLRVRAAPPTSFLQPRRSEEHTSELQSRQYLVCRLLLE